MGHRDFKGGDKVQGTVIDYLKDWFKELGYNVYKIVTSYKVLGYTTYKVGTRYKVLGYTD